MKGVFCVKIECTKQQWNTIYTALLLERERNWGKDEDVVSALSDALKAVQAALDSASIKRC